MTQKAREQRDEKRWKAHPDKKKAGTTVLESDDTDLEAESHVKNRGQLWQEEKQVHQADGGPLPFYGPGNPSLKPAKENGQNSEGNKTTPPSW